MVSILILLDSILLSGQNVLNLIGVTAVSILIILDSLLLFEAFKEVHRSNMTFQSLLYWILFFYCGFTVKQCELKNEFQSLLYWIIFFYNVVSVEEQEYTKVSILILLDSILLYDISDDGKRMTYSFNPYSTGFSSFIKEWLKLIKFVTKFQSLFYWILFFYEVMKKAEEIFETRFQSLFYWILFFYTIRERTRHNSKWGFNPYSTGFYSFIRIKEIEDAMQKLSFNPYSTGFSSFINNMPAPQILFLPVSILILLDSLLLYVYVEEMFEDIQGFNPYSTGFSSFILQYP